MRRVTALLCVSLAFAPRRNSARPPCRLAVLWRRCAPYRMGKERRPNHERQRQRLSARPQTKARKRAERTVRAVLSGRHRTADLVQRLQGTRFRRRKFRQFVGDRCRSQSRVLAEALSRKARINPLHARAADSLPCPDSSHCLWPALARPSAHFAVARPSPDTGRSQHRAPARVGGRGSALSGLSYVLAGDGQLHSGEHIGRQRSVSAAPFLPANAKASSLTLNDYVMYTTTSSGCGGAPNAVWAMDLERRTLSPSASP